MNQPDDELLRAAQREYVRLQAELENDPLFRRFLLVQNVLREFHTASPVIGQHLQANTEQRQRKTKRQRIEDLAKESIRNNGGHSKTATIMQHLYLSEINIKNATVAGYLSSCKDFIPDRVKGWSIREANSKGSHVLPTAR